MYGTGIGTSLVLLATGAVLAMAVDYQLNGLDINAIGVILMVVGLIGLLLSLAFLGQFDMFKTTPRGDHMHDGPASTTHVTHDSEVVREVERPVSETTTTRTTRRL
jgi:hypothetical protein